jgi:tetratricopeptide (TPR) repeat protein
MDQFTAHLDRGWDLAQRGDATGAEASARRALELEAGSPEAHNLLGYSCALRGDYEDALEFYRQAIALDDTFLEAMLNAAELCIFPLGDLEQALSFCEDALGLVENDEEATDALLLQFDAYLGLGKTDQAQATISRVPKGPYANPSHAFLIGRAHFELGEAELAEGLLDEAVRRDPDNPEPHYYLGLIKDERGDVAEATDCFLRVQHLDHEGPAPPWTLGREAFLELVRRVVDGLTPRLRALLDARQVYVAEAPGVEAIVDGADPRAPLLLDQLDGPGPSIRIFVYQRNVERLAGSLDRMEEEVQAALEREVAGALLGAEPEPSTSPRELN